MQGEGDKPEKQWKSMVCTSPPKIAGTGLGWVPQGVGPSVFLPFRPKVPNHKSLWQKSKISGVDLRGLALFLVRVSLFLKVFLSGQKIAVMGAAVLILTQRGPTVRVSP